jgi:hypothetical protein
MLVKLDASVIGVWLIALVLTGAAIIGALVASPTPVPEWLRFTISLWGGCMISLGVFRLAIEKEPDQ